MDTGVLCDGCRPDQLWRGVTPEQRFWANVKKLEGVDACWLWTRGSDAHGFGVLTFEGRQEAVHRVSWRLHFGPIPKGMCVLRRCEQALCVRPDHLWLGTRRDKVNDKTKRDRVRRIAAAPVGMVITKKPKMTDLEIAWTAGLFEGEGSLIVVAKLDPSRPSTQLSLTSTDRDVIVRFAETVGAGRVYGPYQPGAGKYDHWKQQYLWRGHGWALLRRLRAEWGPYLGRRRLARFDEIAAMEPPPYVRINRHQRRFTEDDVRDMRSSYARGETQVAIGKRYGIAQPHVGEIVRLETYKEIA
jgi:hypothetical protein